MLDFEVFQTGIIQEIPYRWLWFNNLIPDEEKLALINTYPQERFREEKGNYFWRAITSRGEVTPETQDFSSVWHRLIEDLWTPAYRCTLEKLTGLDLKDHFMTIGFAKHMPGFQGEPHTDKPYKSLTHLFYFNKEWLPQWGGCLRILRDNQVESTFQDIPPLLGNSVVLVRSDQSWHTVTPISPDVAQPRLTLQIAFWEPEQERALLNHGMIRDTCDLAPFSTRREKPGL